MSGTEQRVIDGKYQILRELGKGGMGAVYEAEHAGTGRRVALKVILSEALAKEKDIIVRFQREARASGSIDSQHVVQILDTGVDPATQSPYMVMELLSGEDVQELSTRLGALPPDLVLRIVAQACMGLGRAHERGIVHRDIKAANVYLSRREGGDRVLKLLDFGVAKVRSDQLSGDHALTRTGTMMGSPLYMSPEQARGAKTLDGRSDLFSLGVLMYEALTGTTPNGGCDSLGELILNICSRHSEAVQNRAPWVPPEVAAIVHKVLALDPAHRFQSAVEMHAAIVALLPQGTGITEGMLAGVTPEMRAHVAPRFEPPSLAAISAGPISFADTMAAPPSGSGSFAVASRASNESGAFVSTTGAAVSTRTVPEIAAPRGRSPSLFLVPLAALIVVGGVGAAGYAFGPWRAKAVAIPVAAASAPVTAPAASAPSAPASASTRTVQVAIVAPADAKVEVDQKAVDVQGGKVDVSGPMSSQHLVRITAGGKTAEQLVSILEIGPYPSKVELIVPKPGAIGARATGPAPSGAGVATGAPAKPAGPPVPPGTPTINRNFN